MLTSEVFDPDTSPVHGDKKKLDFPIIPIDYSVLEEEYNISSLLNRKYNEQDETLPTNPFPNQWSLEPSSRYYLGPDGTKFPATDEGQEALMGHRATHRRGFTPITKEDPSVTVSHAQLVSFLLSMGIDPEEIRYEPGLSQRFFPIEKK